MMDDDFYTAAVVEFSLPTTPKIASAKPERMIETSLDEYLRLINEAAEGKADIIVFPEGSLNYNGIGTRKDLIKFAVELSDIDLFNSTSFSNVCDYSKKSSVGRKKNISCRMPNKGKCLLIKFLFFSLSLTLLFNHSLDHLEDIIQCEAEQNLRLDQRN